MRRVSKMRLGKKLMMCASALLLALTLGMCIEQLSFVSHAQSQGKVIVNSANIRKEPNGSSDALGSAFKDSEVTINHQTTGADGKVWYQVFVDADTLGYIRSDLVQITDGTTPPTKGSETTATPAPSTQETPVAVEAVNPISANVTGSQKVRVRSNASTTSQIVTAVGKGMAITVTGKANGTDGKVWYQVNFINNGTAVNGFIRSDYVALSGELTPPVTDEPSAEPPVDEPQQPADPVIEQKDYETIYENEKWFLIDYEKGVKYAIDDMFNVANQNQQLYTDWEKEHKKVKSQKTTIILLVILMVAMGGVITFLIFKIKDMMDSAYIREVERETIRRRSENRPQGTNQKVMHTVGAEKQPATKPTGAKPVQSTKPAGVKQSQGARPTGVAQPQQTRPAGQGHPSGEKPAGATQPKQTRPANNVQPQEARPVGAAQPQKARPMGEKPSGAAKPQGTRPAGASKPAEEGQTSGWKSKNFMQDDDEFEFEFLHWDGEEEN